MKKIENPVLELDHDHPRPWVANTLTLFAVVLLIALAASEFV